MYRIYTFKEKYRYYWSGSRWTLARWQSKVLTLTEAMSIAKAFDAQYERIENMIPRKRKKQ